MTASPDILVLGHSLEASIAAVRLAIDGWRVTWAGDPPSATHRLDGAEIPVGPTASASLERMPGLSRALVELGVDRDAEPMWSRVHLQLLGEKRREDVRQGAFASAESAVDRLDAAIAGPLALDWRGRRSTASRAEQGRAFVQQVPGLAGEVTQSIDGILGLRAQGSYEGLRVAAGPHRLSGGAAGLVRLLHERFVDLKGHVVPGAAMPVSFRPGLRGVEATLAGGLSLRARLVINGLDGQAAMAVLPKLRETSVPLLRLSLVVLSRGLPMALAPVSVIDGRWLVERLALGDGRDALNVFWRDSGRAHDAQGEDVFERLKPILPFFDRHLRARADVAVVPGASRGDDHHPRPAWRVLRASGPLVGFAGVDAGARLGLAIAGWARTLAPRPKTTAAPGSA